MVEVVLRAALNNIAVGLVIVVEIVVALEVTAFGKIELLYLYTT